MMEGMPSKKLRLSHFVAKELIFEYLSGSLSKDREAAMEEIFSESPDLEKEKASMAAALEYCKMLSGTQVKAELVEKLMNDPGPISKVLGRFSWKQWPDLMKWTTEALVLSSVLVMVSLVIPWSEFESFDFFRLNQRNELRKVSDAVVESSPVVVVPESEAPEPARPEPPVKVAKQEIPVEKPKPAPLEGQLYRMMMKVPNIENRAGDFVASLEKFGAKKAGQVKLGWRKSNGNYFHFSIPKLNYDQVVNTLGEYGPVRIYKQAHRRVMPEGQLRIILWVEDGPVPVKEPEPVPIIDNSSQDSAPSEPQSDQENP